MREYKFRGKATTSTERLDEIGFKHDNGWVHGTYIDGYIINGVEEADIDYIAIGNWCPVIPKTVGEYVEVLDAYDGDVLEGAEIDEYGTCLSRWYGLVKYNDEKSRIMVFDLDEEYWYEVDDYVFDEVVDNVHDNPRLLEVKG